jgi:hypothetical protein
LDFVQRFLDGQVAQLLAKRARPWALMLTRVAMASSQPELLDP